MPAAIELAHKHCLKVKGSLDLGFSPLQIKIATAGQMERQLVSALLQRIQKR
jgi:hypothetical protein